MGRALLSENLNVLANRVETVLTGEVKDDDGSLTVPEVGPRQREELLLALRVPDLQPHRSIFHLDCQAFKVHPDCVHLSFGDELLIDEADQ